MAVITNVQVQSSPGQAVITIQRPYTGQRGDVCDLPQDMRDALWTWLAKSRANYCDTCDAAPCESPVACASARD